MARPSRSPRVSPPSAITGWTGGAYCCWTLHLFHRGPQGLAHIASLPLGKREPDIIRLAPPGGPPIRLADAAFDFWEAPVSLRDRPAPDHPLPLDRPRAGARHRGHAPPGRGRARHRLRRHDRPSEDRPPPEQRITTYPDAAAAIAALRARDWAARGGPHPGVEAARLAACLVYSGHAAEAQRLLRAAWPDGTPGLAETERQIAARLACSPFVAAVRAANPPRAPYTTAACRRDGPDQTAVFALDWR